MIAENRPSESRKLFTQFLPLLVRNVPDADLVWRSTWRGLRNDARPTFREERTSMVAGMTIASARHGSFNALTKSALVWSMSSRETVFGGRGKSPAPRVTEDADPEDAMISEIEVGNSAGCLSALRAIAAGCKLCFAVQ